MTPAEHDEMLASLDTQIVFLKTVRDHLDQQECVNRTAVANNDTWFKEKEELRQWWEDALKENTALKARVAELEVQLATYADHPDVKAAKRRQLEEQMESARIELAKLGGTDASQ